MLTKLQNGALPASKFYAVPLTGSRLCLMAASLVTAVVTVPLAPTMSPNRLVVVHFLQRRLPGVARRNLKAVTGLARADVTKITAPGESISESATVH